MRALRDSAEMRLGAARIHSPSDGMAAQVALPEASLVTDEDKLKWLVS